MNPDEKATQGESRDQTEVMQNASAIVIETSTNWFLMVMNPLSYIDHRLLPRPPSTKKGKQ